MARLAGEIRDWRHLEACAAVAQLRPRLAAVLERAGLRTEAGREARARLAAEALAHAGRARLMAAELVRALEALAGVGIAAVPFKGPAFAMAVGTGLHDREMNDLDLLVEESQLAQAIEALAPMGHCPIVASQASSSPWLLRVTNELPLASVRPFLLELHWRLAPAWHPAPVTVAQVRARLSPQDFFGARISWPAPEELLLVHVADGMKSGGVGMRWLGDIAAILRREPELDWSRVASLARDSGGLGSVSVALALLEGLSEATAAFLEEPAAAIALPPAARSLASRARLSPRLAAAMQSSVRRLASDVALEGAAANFAWALQVSDSRLRTAAAIARHLAGPSVADLESMPRGGSGDGQLRARALARRLGWGTR
jgi:hypothetical protein